MRTVLLSKSDELYLEKCAQEHSFSYGIIVGHQADLNKSIVVHLARNNEDDADLEGLADVRLTIRDINAQALASQWLSASKMCPGSFDVIGIFISSVRPEVAKEHGDEFKNAKKLFSDVYDLLLKSNSSFGVYTTDMAQTDFVFLAYSLADKSMLCKNYTYGNGGTFSTMDYRFVEKPFDWIQLECNYNLDDVIPIVDPARRINIEEQFQNIIVTIRKFLIASEVFLQNEIVEDTIDLQAYIKKKKVKEDKLKTTSSSTNAASAANSSSAAPASALHLISSDDSINGRVIRASIVMPVKCQLNSQNDIQVREFNGILRMSGMIFSRIYCNSRNSIADVKRFLRDDVLRSLITRIQVYCDGLTDPHVSNEAVYISEPPRRVFFNIPVDGGSSSNSRSIQFSEYLFRGEAPTVAVAQAKQVLDVELDPEAIFLDAEGLPEDGNFTNISQSDMDHADDTRSLTSSMPKRELSRSLYMVGIAVALLVLLASVALHYALTG